MFGPFVVFVIVNGIGLYYKPWVTVIFLGGFILFTLAVTGIQTFVACAASIFPLRSDYNKYLPLIKGKTVLITGANRGIGRGLAECMVLEGANLIIAGRSELELTVKELKNLANKHNSRSNIFSYYLDLTDYISIHKFVQQLQKDKIYLDVVVLNAGVTPLPAQQQKDGIDLMLFVMYISNFILVEQLLKYGICKNKSLGTTESLTRPRIVFTSSDTHRWHDYQALPTDKKWQYHSLSLVRYYSHTKLYTQMYANALCERYKNVLDVYGVCPGPVNSDITRSSPWWFAPIGKLLFTVLFQSRFRGGQHLMYVCCKPAQLMPSGTYHWMRFEKVRSAPSLNEKNIQSLMKTTQEWVDELEQKYQQQKKLIE